MSLRRTVTVACSFALVVFGLALVFPSVPSAVAAGGYPPGFVDQTAVSGLQFPTAIDFASDGRMFIAQKSGSVRVVQNGALLPTPFIDLSAEVNGAYEFGLLGLAVDPNFPASPYIYVRYVYDPPGATPDIVAPRVQRVERITANPLNTNVAATGPGSRTVLVGKNGDLSTIVDPNNLVNPTGDPITCVKNGVPVEDCIPADTSQHVGGALVFGADGALYTSIGDFDRLPAGPQTVGSWSGTILRINPATGQGYPTNPFYNANLDSNVSKVWAYGLRNPFRLSANPNTGQMIAGDVGEGTWEELDNVVPGANFGWPCREGPAPYVLYANAPACVGATNFVEPIAVYDHQCCGGAVVAGDWYRGNSYPTEYQGAYFYGDYSQQFIKYMKPNGLGGYDSFDFASGIGQDSLVAIRYAPDGNLYWVDLIAGQIHRIAYVGVGNVPPTAAATASTDGGSAPLTVSFTGSGSEDPNGSALTYAWDFGDGTTSNVVTPPPHIYTVTGNYSAKLTVTNTAGLSSSQTIIIRVNTAPNVTILSPTNNAIFDTGATVNFSATATDATDGNLDAAIQWVGSIRHNVHVHPNYYTASGPTGSLQLVDHGDDMHVELCASATNSVGQTTHSCINVWPTTVAVTVASSPPNRLVTFEGITKLTPYNVTVNKGGSRTLVAPHYAGGCNTFDSWSDGGAEQHTTTVSDATTYTATYLCANGPASLITVPLERVLETRPASGLIGYTGPKPAAGQTVQLSIAGSHGVPSDATAVLLNITGTEATDPGYITAWPCGQPRPNTSNLNLAAGGTDANLALINIGAGGQVCIYTERGAHLIADLAGYIPAVADVTATPPVRVLETRPSIQVGYTGDKPAPGQTVQVDLTGRVNPDTAAVWLNVTGTDATNAGFVTVWPCGQPRPNASNLNLRSGGTDANLAFVRLGVNNTVCIYTEAGTHLIADLAGTATTTARLNVLTPTRRLETRPGAQINYQGNKPVAGQTIEMLASGVAGIPIDATAVLLTITGTDATNPGFVTVWPCGQPRPNTSNLNLAAGGTDANLVLTTIGNNGKICIYTEAGTHLIADLAGYTTW